MLSIKPFKINIPQANLDDLLVTSGDSLPVPGTAQPKSEKLVKLITTEIDVYLC